MKKSVACLVIFLVVSMSVSVFASEPGISFDDATTSGSTASLQLLYAKLQLEQSEIIKQQALDRMEQIQKLQEEQRKVAGYLNTAKQTQNEAESSGTTIQMPSDMAEYMKNNGLSNGTGENGMQMNAEEWASVSASLSNHLNQLGTQTQQQMVYMQDIIGQYNSYLNGANEQINNSNNTVNTVNTVTYLARGQSMYGDSEAGLAVTALIVGLVLGCLITVSVQKIRRKAEKA